MNISSDREKEIIEENADLVHLAIMAIFDDQHLPMLKNNLVLAESNGWGDLVKAIRSILKGARNKDDFTGLDAEDSVIVFAILQGIKNPSTLPALSDALDPEIAAPVIAYELFEVSNGNEDAKEALKSISMQFRDASGDFEKISDSLDFLIAGERESTKLCEGLADSGKKLIKSILAELTIFE
jgi:hypothetical protein